MARKTNFTQSNGKEVYRLQRKVGKKLNKDGKWIDDVRSFYGSCESDALAKFEAFKKKRENGCKNITSDCIGEAIDKWIDSHFNCCELADSSKKRYTDAYKKYMKPNDVAGIPLAEIEAIDIHNFYNTTDAPISAIEAIQKLLVRFFKYCELNGLHHNIMNAVDIPKETKSDADYIKDDIDVWNDLDLQRAIYSLKGNRLRLFVVLAVNTGARFSELLALTYDDIQGNLLRINKQLTEVTYGANKGIRLSDTKTINANRYIPLTNETLAEVREHKQMHQKEMRRNKYKTNFIFTTNTGAFYWRSIVSRSLARHYKRIGVPYHKVHSFRHTFGTNLSRAGVPIEEVKKLMGHSDISITAKYYLNIDAQRQLDAVSKIAKYSYGNHEEMGYDDGIVYLRA